MRVNIVRVKIAIMLAGLGVDWAESRWLGSLGEESGSFLWTLQRKRGSFFGVSKGEGL
jgi:hypothetical protein